jgi:Concanavalin A-like lectin/glucanases superfamily
MPLSLLVRPPTLARKPAWPFRLNRDSWQAAGLASWVTTDGRGGGVIDRVSGLAMPYFNGASDVGTALGLATDCSVAADAGALVPVGTSSALVLNDVTIAAMFYVVGTPDVNSQFWAITYDTTDTSPFIAAGLAVNNLGVAVFNYNVGGAFLQLVPSGGTTIASFTGQLVQMVATRRASTSDVALWLNGQQVGTANTGFTGAAITASPTLVYGMYENGIGRKSNVLMLDGRLYSRVLSDGEIAALWQPHNLWALYQPTRRFWAMGDPAAVTSGFLLVKN